MLNTFFSKERVYIIIIYTESNTEYNFNDEYTRKKIIPSTSHKMIMYGIVLKNLVNEKVILSFDKNISFAFFFFATSVECP